MKEILSRLRPHAKRVATEAMNSNGTSEEAPDIELENEIPADNTTSISDDSKSRASPKQDNDSDGDLAQNNAQAGVQKMEATTQVWTKKHLVAAYVM